jgi:hypothetical protein
LFQPNARRGRVYSRRGQKVYVSCSRTKTQLSGRRVKTVDPVIVAHLFRTLGKIPASTVGVELAGVRDEECNPQDEEYTLLGIHFQRPFYSRFRRPIAFVELFVGRAGNVDN